MNIYQQIDLIIILPEIDQSFVILRMHFETFTLTFKQEQEFIYDYEQEKHRGFEQVIIFIIEYLCSINHKSPS